MIGDAPVYMFFIKDHLGSVRAVVSETGEVLQTNEFYPYGDLFSSAGTADTSGNRYRFTGKELGNETGLYDFSARFLQTSLGRFTTLDPLAEKMYSQSPYLYCSSNPINRIDIDGLWDISVSASENRGKNPYAVMTIKNRQGSTIYKTVVKVLGSHRKRNLKNGDTPIGDYRILEWRETGNDRYPSSSYGPNDLLALEYIGEEGEGRSGIHIHGGRDQENSLMGTYGCFRINDDDIAEIKTITDQLEKSDPLEAKGILTLNNDLDTPVKYEDRNEIKYNWERYIGDIEPAYVTN